MSQETACALVVEDEWLPRMDIADALSEIGWDVVECATGQQALDFLTSGAAVRLLVTDIRLPGTVNGWDIALKLREINPNAVVVYCSGNPIDEKRRVNDSVFFAKPCPMDRLLQAAGRPDAAETA